MKAGEQRQRWSEQEYRARDRAEVADVKADALAATDDAKASVEMIREILHATLAIDDRLDWSAMKDKREFEQPQPTLEQAQSDVQVPPRRGIVERLSSAAKTKRLEAEAKAQAAFEDAASKWEASRERHNQMRDKRNRELEQFQSDYENGIPEAVERYASLVLASSAFPDGFERDCEVSYSPADHVLVVDCHVPSPDDVPTEIEYRYVASRREVDVKHLKPKQISELYEDGVIQTALRTVHEIFEGDYEGHCHLVVVNARVSAIDRATGQDFDACIASLQAERQAFAAIELARVEPRACFRSLKGLSGSNLAAMQPVQPIRSFNKEDPRFIEADGVLDGLEADQNLMTMAWQDFEILVRDLFNEMFGGRGADVRVTRTSRDQGVDAVVFDPDPLLGGKIVIQAKRYRKTVPVAAVRELYGTMLNEGAGKGILVTTSHYGASANEFAKDKPLTLIDGANLLHLMQNHGHRIRIDLSEGVSEEDLVPAPS